MRWFSSLFQAAAIVLILVGASVAGEAPKFRVYLTAEETEGVPTGKPSTEFGCRDTVYAVVQATDLKLGSHVLEASWIDPQRNQRERTRHPFEARQKATTMWVWLRLHPPTHAVVTGLFDPSAGMGEFIGDWTVRFYVDGKSVDKKSFNVLC